MNGSELKWRSFLFAHQCPRTSYLDALASADRALLMRAGETPQIPTWLRRLLDCPRQASNRSVHKNQDGLRTKYSLVCLTNNTH